MNDLAALVALLQELPRPAVVLVRAGTFRGRIELTAADGPELILPGRPPQVTAGAVGEPAILTRVHRRLIEHATTAPVTARALVRKAGYKLNSYSRSALTYLCRCGLIVHTPDGYQLPRPQLGTSDRNGRPTGADPFPSRNGHLP